MKINTCDNRPVLNPCSLEDLNYQVDPYIGCEHFCHYCYVLDEAETDWKNEILMHADIAERLKSELSDIPPQRIYMGWHTDPYQPCEKESRQTRSVLETIVAHGSSVSLLTKSNLVLRDLDLLKKMERPSVSMSVAFDDDHLRQLFEYNTIPTEARIDALAQIKRQGIMTAALICPVIPFITNVHSLVAMLAPHTDKIWIYGLSVLDQNSRGWQNVKEILEHHLPGLRKKVEAAVLSKENNYWSQIRKELQTMATDQGLNLSIHL